MTTRSIQAGSVADWFKQIDSVARRAIHGETYYRELIYTRNMAGRQAIIAQDKKQKANAAAWLAVEAYAGEAANEVEADRALIGVA